MALTKRASRLATDPIRDSSDPIEHRNLGRIDYITCWKSQQEAVEKRAAGHIGDQIWSLTHPSVYTAGRQTQPMDRPTNGCEVVDVDRGGRITWHGPGQLVCYPIIKLGKPIDVVAFVRRIEEAVIALCRDFGIDNAGRIEGRTGVWLPAGQLRPERKIAAIGVRVSHQVTMHGVSLNCCNTLAYYDHIVPCGIDDASVTTMSAELGRRVEVDEVKDRFVTYLMDAFDGRLPVDEHIIIHQPSDVKGEK